MNHDVMTVREVAALLRVHPSTIYRQTKAGHLPGFRVASEWRFTVASIDTWRAAQEQRYTRTINGREGQSGPPA